MAKDDSLKKPKKKDFNRMMIFISAMLISFLWIVLFLFVKKSSELVVAVIISVLILVWVALLVKYIYDMKNTEKSHFDEQIEEVLRTGKANYLMQKKLIEKIENIREKVAVPADEIITAQKAIAKLTLARNKENTDALMHSNEQVIEKTLEVEEKLSENNQQIIDMQKSMMDEKIQELMEKQKLVLDNLNTIKETLESDMQNVLSEMIHDTLEKELSAAIEQIHTYVKEAASQAADSIKADLAAENPVMTASAETTEKLPDLGMSAVDDELPDLGMSAADEKLPDLGMSAADEKLPDLGMSAADEELPDLGMSAVDEELPDLGMSAIGEELPDLGMSAVDDDLSDMELPTLGDELSVSGDWNDEPVVADETTINPDEPVITDETTIDPDEPVFTEDATDADTVTLTEEIPVSPDESVIEEVKIPEEETITEEIPISADESVIEEVPKQEAAASMPDMGNPNKIMTPDEIAALIANL